MPLPVASEIDALATLHCQRGCSPDRCSKAFSPFLGCARPKPKPRERWTIPAAIPTRSGQAGDRALQQLPVLWRVGGHARPWPGHGARSGAGWAIRSAASWAENFRWSFPTKRPSSLMAPIYIIPQRLWALTSTSNAWSRNLKSADQFSVPTITRWSARERSRPAPLSWLAWL